MGNKETKKRYQERHFKKGLCRDCNRPREFPHILCQFHREQRRPYHIAYRRQQVEERKKNINVFIVALLLIKKWTQGEYPV